MEITFEKLARYETGKHRLKQLKLATHVNLDGIVVTNKRNEAVLMPCSIDEYISFCKGVIYVLEHKKNNITSELTDKEDS